MDHDLGYFDLDTRVLEPLDNPFGPRLSPPRPYILPTNCPNHEQENFFPDVYATGCAYQKLRSEPRFGEQDVCIVGPFKR